MAQGLVRCYSPVVLQSYTPDLAPTDPHLFGPLGGRPFHNSEVEMADRELLRMQEPIYTATEFLNSSKDGTDASACSGIVEK
jgi:hypothetical protein